MVVICNGALKDDVKFLIESEIQKYRLKIQPEKTQIFYFIRGGKRFNCYYETKSGKLINNKNLEYLGFQFDGQYALLKSSSLASFYRKMKRTLHRSTYYAMVTSNKSTKGELFKTRLFKKFSHLGSHRHRKYKKEKNNPGKWIVTDTYDWGNYLSYAYLAARNMKYNKIKHQVKNHWRILNELIKEKERRLRYIKK